MRKQLVLVPGRVGAAGDATALKARWLDALSLGLKRAGLQVPQADVRVAFCGEIERVDTPSANELSDNGSAADIQLEEFRREVLEEVAANRDVLDFQPRGIQTSERIRGLLQALDACDGVNVPLIMQTIDDVHRYLANPTLRAATAERIREQVDPNVPAVVVGHALGSVIAYDAISDEKSSSWTISGFVTLGSPLGVGAIRAMLHGAGMPSNVARWCNARDPSDGAAFFPLDPKHFPVRPPAFILDKSDVSNRAADHHGVEGYLSDAEIARWIHFALR